MVLTVVKTTALSGTITNAQLAGSIDLTAKVTGTLPTGNGGTGSTATTFVNVASNVTGTLPVANGGTALSSGFINGVANVGKINQITRTFSMTGSAVSTTSTSMVDSGITVSITPSATDSVIMIDFACGMSTIQEDTAAQTSLYRAIGAGADTEISTNPYDWSYTNTAISAGSPNYNNYYQHFTRFFDTTHGTTSACAYKIYFLSASAARAYYLAHSNIVYSMIATEILA